jgi:signal transduction histidine kinase
VSRITQVVMSLLGNAIERTPPGRAIRVMATEVANDVVVGIKDEGAGFEEADLSQLFRRIGGAGSGLSLYISRRLIEEHGGRMWVESEGPAHGATFYFSLPRWREDLGAAAG